MLPPARSPGSACWQCGPPNFSSGWRNPRAAPPPAALRKCPTRAPAARAFRPTPGRFACCSWLHRHELIVDARHVDARGFELLQLVAQGARTDAEALRGELAIAAGDAQRRQYQLALPILEVAVQAGIERRSRLPRIVSCRRIPPNRWACRRRCA